MVIRDISPELQEKAVKEINEDPTRISENLENIQHWITTQSHLKCRTDEQWLIGFLRGCKYDLDKTKMKLDNFYSSRTLIPDFFDNRDPLQPEIQDVLKAGIFLPLPTTIEPDGPRIIFIVMKDVPNKKVHMLHIIKVYFMMLDLLVLEDDNTTIAGTFTLSDCDVFPMNYLLQLTPTILKKAAFCMQDCYPIRIKQLHAIRAPLGAESMVNLLKTFLSEKLRKRFHVHGKRKSKDIETILPKQYLLEDEGGANGKREELIEYWKNKMEYYRDWFIEDDKFRTVERLRGKKARTLANVFGIADSFNKLNID